MNKTKKILTSLLLITTALNPPILAEDNTRSTEALEKRVAELESMLRLLTQKLDTQEVAISEQRTRLNRAEPAIKKVIGNVDGTASVDGFIVGNTQVKVGGYIKADVIVSKNTAGAQAGSGSIVRDFYIPGTVPVGGQSSSWAQDFTARQTRLFLTTNTKFGDESVGTRLELDFNVTGGGDERISNSYTPRLRHAFVTYGGWLA